jgi:hypothetical protein
MALDSWRTAAVTVLAVSLGGIGLTGAAGAEQVRQIVPGGQCPTTALQLPADGVANAAEEALSEAAKDYPGVDTRGAQVMAADRSSFAGARGDQVVLQCGREVGNHTVVVQLLFPKMLPSASLSQGVVDVSHFDKGYRVWEVVH